MSITYKRKQERDYWPVVLLNSSSHSCGFFYFLGATTAKLSVQIPVLSLLWLFALQTMLITFHMHVKGWTHAVGFYKSYGTTPTRTARVKRLRRKAKLTINVLAPCSPIVWPGPERSHCCLAWLLTTVNKDSCQAALFAINNASSAEACNSTVSAGAVMKKGTKRLLEAPLQLCRVVETWPNLRICQEFLHWSMAGSQRIIGPFASVHTVYNRNPGLTLKWAAGLKYRIKTQAR